MLNSSMLARTIKAVSLRRPTAVAAMSCVLLQGCVVLPATVEDFDLDCQVVTHHMVLQTVQLAEINHCANQSCLVLVVGAAATAAASLIVSGSVVVVGNAVYWVEKRSSCTSVR
jgi:hypothetical protein